jgi:hypothetical protein
MRTRTFKLGVVFCSLAFAVLVVRYSAGCERTETEPTAAQEARATEKSPAQAEKPKEVKRLPRRPIGGLHGIETRSTLRYADSPDETQSFEAIYVFPDRARWEFELASGERRRVYRSGDALFFAQSGPSQPLGDAQHDRLLGDLELRRAMLLWPGGFEWKETDDGPESDLDVAGRLRAKVDEKTGELRTLWLLAPDGTPLESFRELRWRTDGGRRWPVSLEFWHGDTLLWNETFDRTSPARYVESFFVPPDRRESDAPTEAAQGEQPLQPFTSFRLELPSDTSWDDAQELERQARSRWAEKLPKATISDRPTFVIGEKGTPVAALLRIEPPLSQVPKGWTAQGPRRGIGSFMPYKTLSSLDRERVSWMRSLVPSGAKPAAPYVRIDRKGGLIQLVQPFLP